MPKHYVIACYTENAPVYVNTPGANTTGWTCDRTTEATVVELHPMALGGPAFDPVSAGMFFGFAFASTMFVWLFSLGCGMVLRAIRR